MNTKNLFFYSLIGAIAITLLANIPFVNLVNCLLCIGFWGGATLAVWLYKRASGPVTLGQAVAIGSLTGLFAGLIGFTLSFLGVSGAQGMLNTYGRLFAADSNPDLTSALSGNWVILFNLGGAIINVLFGAVGGLVGGLILRQDKAGKPN